MAKLLAGTSLLVIALLAFLTISAPYASSMWASSTFTLTLVVLLGSIVAAALCVGRTQRYWQGFALAAGAYFVCIWFYLDSWWVTGLLSEDFSRRMRPSLPTTRALAWIYDHCGGEELWTGGGTRAPAAFMISADRQNIPNYMDVSWLDAFMGGGESVMALLLGLLGGLAAVAIANREARGKSIR